MPNFSSIFPASLIMGKSESDPITIPTSAWCFPPLATNTLLLFPGTALRLQSADHRNAA
jgi:hypothetical protein